MELVREQNRRTISPWIPAALVVAWIAAVTVVAPLPGSTSPFGDSASRPYVPLLGIHFRVVMTLGTALTLQSAAFLAEVFSWTQPFAFEHEQQPWQVGAFQLGTLLGWFVAATLPPWWIVWTTLRIVARRASAPEAGPEKLPRAPVEPPSRPAAPALALTVIWSIIAANPALILGWRLLNPVETWLMLPPMKGLEAAVETPLEGWCAYYEHRSAIACSAHQENLRRKRAHSNRGFGYVRSRCVPAAQVPQLSRRKRITRRLIDTLRRTVEGRATVWTRGQIPRESVAGDPEIAVVRGDAASGDPILLVEFANTYGENYSAILEQHAVAGVPEFWVVQPPARTEFGGGEIAVWLKPNPDKRRYDRRTGLQAGQDHQVELSLLPGATIHANDVFPPLCR